MVREFDERNMARSRNACEAMAEAAKTGKRVLTERERQILNMWPRFEDGELVMPGDKVHYASAYNDETEIEVESITTMDGCFVLCDDGFRSNQYEQGQRVKRPARSVLDADGVEIGVGDTVYEPNGKRGTVVRVHPQTGCVDLSQGDCDAYCMDAESLTHTRPDSWGRLEEDAAKGLCEYFGFSDRPCNEGEGCPAYEQGGCAMYKAKDLVRRAKALAGVEVVG